MIIHLKNNILLEKAKEIANSLKAKIITENNKIISYIDFLDSENIL